MRVRGFRLNLPKKAIFIKMEEFGHDLKKKHFLLREDLVNFNHGSFGAVPKCVMNELIRLLHEVESFPDLWFRDTMYRLEDRSRELVAELIHADKEDVVMVENASYAINSVLRSFPFQVIAVLWLFVPTYLVVM
ncbi:hypothetical protein EON65_24435 [archaeon]|nr:MAG: hypothetical protein EON65_24435 [archaeon]